jgi:hypothetical protein
MYAFLLRNVLGPFLDPASLRQLHESLEMSLLDGRCTLTDIVLNTDYLHKQTKTILKFLPLLVHSIRIRSLTVQLKLQETASKTATTSSLAWRALQLGSTEETNSDGSAIPKVSLFVHVELEGVSVEVEPRRSDASDWNEPNENESAALLHQGSTTTRSLLSSYLNAALASLQLSVDFKNLSIRLWNGANQGILSQDDASQCWIQICCQALSYQTIPATSTLPQTSESCTEPIYETTLHKALNIQRITVLTGSSVQGSTAATDSNVSTIALMEGSTRVSLRLIEYRAPSYNRTSNGIYRSVTTEVSRPHVQQDLEVTLNQKMNVSVDACSLALVYNVVRSIQSTIASSTSRSVTNIKEREQTQADDKIDCSTVEEKLLADIMRQYQEAKQQVERNVYRGGILIPLSESRDQVTFDAFFDANDQSFYHYSTVLRQSILSGTDPNTSPDEQVRIKFRLYLQEGGIKLILASGESSAVLQRKHEEYVLVVFHDFNASSSISSGSSKLALSVDRMEIEDSVLVSGIPVLPVTNKKVEIGSILRFCSGYEEDAGCDDTDLLLQSPCLSLNIAHRCTGTVSTEVEIELDPIEFTCRFSTMKLLALFCKELAENIEKSDEETDVVESPNKESKTGLLKFSTVCPSWTILFPVVSDGGWSRLHKRCGFSCGLTQSSRSALVVNVEDLVVDVITKKVPSDVEASLTIRNIYVFAVSPELKSILEKKALRFDILALCGRSEVETCMSISIRALQPRNERDKLSGTHSDDAPFPKVLPISTFKARQEDEDEDNRVDRILCSKMREIAVGTRKQLRGTEPQEAMLESASKSDIIVSIGIPEIFCDLTIEEAVLLHKMVLGLLSSWNESPGNEAAVENESVGKRVSVAFGCDSVSLAIHEDTLIDPNQRPCSFVVKADKLKSHVLTNAGRLEHVRFLVHDFHFCEGKRKFRIVFFF